MRTLSLAAVGLGHQHPARRGKDEEVIGRKVRRKGVPLYLVLASGPFWPSDLVIVMQKKKRKEEEEEEEKRPVTKHF